MKIRFALCAMLLSITSTIAFGQTVSVNYNHSQSFAQYHTYAWQIDDPNKIANSILAQVAISNTDSALAGKGLSKVDISANPDLIVGFIPQTRTAEERAAQGRRQEARFEIARRRCDPWMN